MWCHVAAVVFPAVSVLWQDGQSAQTTPTPEEINRAIEELGDDKFAVRERASNFLWKTGKAAEVALVKAATSRDPEVALRARRILRKFKYGIYPDTPEEVVQLVAQFRYGNQVAKQAVLRKLMDTAEMPTLLKLLKTELDENLRKQLTEGLARDIDKLAGALFISGNFARAEQFLEIGATSDAGMRHYAAYLLLRDQLEAKISELKDRVAGAPNTVDARLLVHLLRARGDLRGALRASEKASDPDLTASVLFELGDWKELARTHDKLSRDAQGRMAGGIVHLGYTAAFHRLAGNGKELEEAVAAIQELAERKPNKLWYCGEALLINDRFQDAVNLLKEERTASAFQILCLQSRFREALELAGIRDPRGPYSPWFEDSQTEPEAGSTRKSDRFAIGLRVASMLYRLGEKEESLRLFSQLAQAAEEDKDLSMRSVCEAEYELGLTEQAFEHAVLVLSKGWNTPATMPRNSVLWTLFPKRRNTAEIWWTFFCRKYPEEPRKATIDRLRKMLAPAPPEESRDDAWLDLVEEAEKGSQELKKYPRGKWLTVLGETCLAGGKRRRARSYFEQAAEVTPSVSALIRVGDLAAADTQWQQAAEWYRRAWEKDHAKPTALYLQGRVLVQAGQEAEGRKLIEAARLLPLGNADTRYSFAKELQQRGLNEEAARQWKLIVQTGEFESFSVSQAAEQLGNLASGKEDLKAAAYWQWPLLRCLRTNTAILGVEGYLELSHQIHKARARGLLAAGRIDQALREIRLSHAALPGETELACDLVPQLEKAGRLQAADELFAKVFEVNQRVCDDFPHSANHHNNLGWLAARCNRRLDKALAHAGRAVELDPDNPAHIDTLAEVHFRRGQRDKAIKLAKRCVELAPQEQHFRRQLRRFQQR